MALEYQRYGRNKQTLVNKTYIESGEYRRKFDKLTDNSEVNKTLYDCAKKALYHRSGTELEDMYWIDSETGKIIAEETNGTAKKNVTYSAKTLKVISSYPKRKIITIHNHPGSMPPSIADFNSCCDNGYYFGIVVCHDGKVFRYSSEYDVSAKLYDMYIARGIKDRLTEYEAQFAALSAIKRNAPIDFEEVK